VPEGHSAQPSSEDLARRQEAMMRRRTEHKLFKKKTSHGQPVMKYRIEKLLHKLASD